jgi:hypothetical protein
MLVVNTRQYGSLVAGLQSLIKKKTREGPLYMPKQVYVSSGALGSMQAPPS